MLFIASVLYRYQQNAYNELVVKQAPDDGLTFVVSKDRGNRVESITVPAQQVALMLQAVSPSPLTRAP